jgi:hypothetical protein
MLSGFGGHLLSESYLERCLEQHAPVVDVDRTRRELSAWRARCRALGPASALRSMLEIGAEPLLAALGYGKPSDVLAQPGTWISTILSGCPRSGAAPSVLVVTPWGARLDSLWRPAVVEARRRGARWCVAFNGTHVRLIGAGRLYSRRFAEFDLDLAVEDERACLALQMLLGCHDPSVASSLEDLVEASERHSAAVCRSLRHGVLDASSGLLGALLRRASNTPLDSAFEQALTIVYRILFLLFAEARHLVPLWHPVYRDSYSLDALGAAAFRGAVSPGLWEAIRAACRLAHDGCVAGDLRVTAFNGRLFAPARAPLAERRDLDDQAARGALIALATQPGADGECRERIAYRDLGVEQLGAVYEALLDYTPRREPSTRTVTLESGAGRRKATSTFYTPQSITQYLVRHALGPLVREASAEGILALRVLDPAMGSGAFLVACCAFLAEAYEAALVRDNACHPGDLGPAERAAIRRTVAERCLFGVDLNPMAVQLARLSLWLATLAADRPLSFLDHHLQAGDSILGAWVASIARAPRLGRVQHADAKGPLFEDADLGEALRLALPIRFSLALDPSDTPEQVKSKDRALDAMARPGALLSKWKRIANLWCSYWFADRRLPGSAFGALSDSILTGRSLLPSADRYLGDADAIAQARHFFHWELEFPEAFFDRQGVRLPNAGFDAVVGNPPWDMIRADAGDTSARAHARKDAGSVLRFTRDSGTYRAQSAGPRQSVSAVRRTGSRARAIRWTDRPCPAVGFHQRSRERAAAPLDVRPLRRRHTGWIREPRRRFPHPPERQVHAADSDPGRPHDGHPLPARRTEPGRARQRGRGTFMVSAAGHAGAARTRVGRRPGAARVQISGRPCHRRTRRRAVSTAWPLARLARSFRPGVECHRGPPRARRRGTRVTGPRGQAPRAVPRRRLGNPLDHLSPERGSSPWRPLPPVPPGVSRCRKRDQSRHAHRGAPAGLHRLDTHHLLSQNAVATREPAFSVRSVQQLRSELPGAPACHDARHDGDRRAASGPPLRRIAASIS